MTRNNSNKVNDNEMLICQRLKLTICGRAFFVMLRLSSNSAYCFICSVSVVKLGAIAIYTP